MFLIYTNDISEQVSSPLCFFADDCLLYRLICNKADAQLLQLDLDCLSQWSKIWQMSFNVSKCVVMKCSKSPSIITFNYSLDGHLLDTKTEYTYLGIILQDTTCMSWASHINSIVKKASRTLNFLKRNLSSCSQKVKESAYFTIVCPISHQVHINSLENVQRRSARWVCSTYSNVTAMIKSLN